MNHEERKIHPAFYALVKKALATEFEGGLVKLIKVASEADSLEPYSGHYFTFRLPFSGLHIDWELLFDPENPCQPPDFLCAEDIGCDPEIYCQTVQFWDSQMDDCLTKLLHRLSQIYRRCKASQIVNFPTSAEIYQSLVDAGIAKENIEACYLPKERRFNFLIKLNIADEGLPPVKNHGYSLCYAGLLYSLGRDGKILTHSLIISPYLGHVLGSHVEQLQLTFSASQTIDVNVLHEFNATLDRVLNKIRQSHKRRRNIVSTLLALYPCNVVLYDEDLYSQVTLLFKLEEARYVARLEELEGEMKVYLFAIDCPVKTNKDIPYTETETLSLTHKSSSPGFSKHLHKTLSSRIKLFINRAKKHASS